jgi:endonuclease G
MANFRKNHHRNNNPFVGLSFRVFIILGILVVFFLGVNHFFKNIEDDDTEELLISDNEVIERDYLPSYDFDLDLVHHHFYSLGYNEELELAQWVAYVITKDDLKIPNVKRNKDYMTDPKVASGSAHYKDYSGSGYTPGHLAPAGDMAFNKLAMKESFYMSNISPQIKAFNNGIWKELEENVRDWAYNSDMLYVVTGPLVRGISERIGRNEVGVPKSFFKAILDNSGTEKKSIGFIIPNDLSDKRLEDYAVSVDDIERSTGLDLFSHLYSENEAEIESRFDIKKWKWSDKRYKLRVNKWNKE